MKSSKPWLKRYITSSGSASMGVSNTFGSEKIG